MGILISILSMIGLVLAGFLLSEVSAAYLGRQEKESKLYFSFIGITFTQNDAQRLLFALFLGLGVFLLESYLVNLTGVDMSIYIAYFVTGYSPTIVMHFIEKKIKNKTK